MIKKRFFLIFLIGIILIPEIGTSGFYVIPVKTSSKSDGLSGPYYLYWDNTCHALKIYIVNNIVYGKEIMCGESSPNTIYGGGWVQPNKNLDQLGAGNSKVIFSFGYNYNSDPRILTYRSDKTVTIYKNNGASLSVFISGTWNFGTEPAADSLTLLESTAYTNPNAGSN